MTVVALGIIVLCASSIGLALSDDLTSLPGLLFISAIVLSLASLGATLWRLVVELLARPMVGAHRRRIPDTGSSYRPYRVASRKQNAADPKWTSPTVIAALLGAVSSLAAALIGNFKPDPVDCADVRAKTTVIFDSHPEAWTPYPAGSREEKKCHINEFHDTLIKK